MWPSRARRSAATAENPSRTPERRAQAPRAWLPQTTKVWSRPIDLLNLVAAGPAKATKAGSRQNYLGSGCSHAGRNDLSSSIRSTVQAASAAARASGSAGSSSRGRDAARNAASPLTADQPWGRRARSTGLGEPASVPLAPTATMACRAVGRRGSAPFHPLPPWESEDPNRRTTQLRRWRHRAAGERRGPR